MKLKILKKMIKEGVSERTGKPYKIKSLFVKFTDSTIYAKIVAKLIRDGATMDQIEKFCRPSEYKGEMGYVFSLNCSNLTFDKVENFGEIDALIDFSLNDSGFINARIAIVDRIEQVLKYTEPTIGGGEQVDGWAADEKVQGMSPENAEGEKEPELPSEEPENELPF